MSRTFLSRVVRVALTSCAAVSTMLAQTTTCSTPNGNGSTCSTTVTPTLLIPKLSQLEVGSASTFSLQPASGSITAADYVTGSYDVGATITVTARANSTWSASIRAATPNFNAPCSGKVAGDLRFGRTTATRTIGVSTTAQPVFVSASNAATAGLTQQLFFNVQLGWAADAPGTCALPLTFSILAP